MLNSTAMQLQEVTLAALEELGVQTVRVHLYRNISTHKHLGGVGLSMHFIVQPSLL